MRKYRFDLWIFLSIFALHIIFVIGQKVERKAPIAVFPFFAWDLFAKVPQKVTEYQILIDQMDKYHFVPARDVRAYWKPLRRHDPSNFFPVPTQLRLRLCWATPRKLKE